MNKRPAWIDGHTAECVDNGFERICECGHDQRQAFAIPEGVVEEGRVRVGAMEWWDGVYWHPVDERDPSWSEAWDRLCRITKEISDEVYELGDNEPETPPDDRYWLVERVCERLGTDGHNHPASPCSKPDRWYELVRQDAEPLTLFAGKSAKFPVLWVNPVTGERWIEKP